MIEESMDAIREGWERRAEMTLPRAERIDQVVNELIRGELEEIEALAEKGEAEAALAQLAALISFFNAAAAKVPSIIKRLQKWVKKLKGAVEAIAKALGASGYSISVGWPGISVGLSYSVI